LNDRDLFELGFNQTRLVCMYKKELRSHGEFFLFLRNNLECRFPKSAIYLSSNQYWCKIFKFFNVFLPRS